MTKLRSAVQNRGLEVCLRAGTCKFDGNRFWLRRGGLRQKHRTMVCAAQELLKRKLVLENFALEFFPVTYHDSTPVA